MLFFLLVLLTSSPANLSSVQDIAEYRRSCGDGVFCPSYDEGGRVMCCRGEVLVREDGLFFNKSCCTLDQWLKSEVLSRGEVLWLEDEGEAENEGDEDEMLRMKNEEKEDVFTDENEALWQEDEGKAENEELYEMSPRVGFQGEGGLVEGMEVQSFLMDQGANRQTNEEHQSSKVMTMSPEILPSTDNKQKSTVVVQNTRTNSWPNGSSGHQDEEDGAADVVGDIEDKLEEVEEEQRSIRERVHRVNSWNEVFRVLVVSLLAIVIVLLVSLLCRFTHSCCGKRSSETNKPQEKMSLLGKEMSRV